MPRTIRLFFAAAVISLAILPLQALAADSFAGNYTGDKLSVEIMADGTSYTGTVHLGAQAFPLKAQANGGQLTGTFSSKGHDFPFTATLAGDSLSLTSSNATYSLTRAAPPAANPLAAPPPANPLAAGAPSAGPAPAAATPASSDVPAGYGLAAATESGKAWVAQKPGATTVTAALQGTLADLATFFGNKPVPKGAFEDTKDHQSGGAAFTATAGGKPIAGLITCKIADKQALISVTWCLASATPADWAKLNAAPAQAKPPAPAAPPVPLTEFQFPDGTGSVGIAAGWTLKSGSVLDPLWVTGPADQTIGGPGMWWITIELPNSPRIRQAQQTQKQMDDNYRRMGRQPPPPQPPIFPVADFADPEHALPIVVPQWNAFKLAHHLEGIAIDKISSAQSVDSLQPGWKTQILQYGMTQTVDGVAKHYQAKMTWSSSPPTQLLPNTWALFPGMSMVAPDASFDKDLPVMEAMPKSIKINWDVYMKVDWERFEARMKANKMAFDESMKIQRQKLVEQMKAADDHNRQWAIDENRKSRYAADWIEYAGGYRTVIDTQTGQRTSVDLSNVNGIVNALNDGANDPHRFVQIPLRDERDPLIAP